MEVHKIIVSDDLIDTLYPDTHKIILTLTKEDVEILKDGINGLIDMYYQHGCTLPENAGKMLTVIESIVTEAEKETS